MRNVLLLAAFIVLLATPARAQSLYGPPALQIPAWTPVAASTRYPAEGTFDLSAYAYLGGTVGLNPGSVARGVLTLYWTADAAGTTIVGVQGLSLAAQIVSLDQLRLPNQGAYLYAVYTPLMGDSQLAACLFGTNAAASIPEIPGDTILLDVAGLVIPANTSVAVYPDDYFSGEARLSLQAPAGVVATLYGMDLTDQFWPLDATGPGSLTTVTPLGVWMVVFSNFTSSAASVTAAVTPLVGVAFPRQ